MGCLFSSERKDYMYQLIIAEKPSVAQTIAAALGAKEKKDGYIEGSCYLIYRRLFLHRTLIIHIRLNL